MKHSIIWNTNPRLVSTVSKDVYESLPQYVVYGSIDIPTRAALVSKLLKSRSAPEKIARYLPESEIERHMTPPKYVHPIDVPYKGGTKTLDIGSVLICFDGAIYISNFFISSKPSLRDVSANLPEMDVMKCTPKDIYGLRGMYIFSLNMNVESHGFVLYITDDHITVYNTYGGCNRFYIERFEREEWIDFMVLFFDADPEEQYHKYHIPWGFERDMVEPQLVYGEKVVFVDMFYQKLL